MKLFLLNITCLLFSCSLLSAQITLSYGHGADIVVELSDLGEEIPTEDTADAEQELEIEITDTYISLKFSSDKEEFAMSNLFLVLDDRSNDIPFPPPDFS